MPAWDERLAGSDAKRALNELASAVKTSPEMSSASAVDKWNRLVRVVDYLTAVWKAVDPLLLTGTLVDPLNASMSNALAAVRQFEATGEEGSLDNVHAYLDQVLDVVARWPVAITASDVEDLREAASSYRRTAGQLLRSIETDAKHLEGSVGTARSELAEIAQAAREAIGSEREAVEGRFAEVTAAIQAQATRLDKTMSTQNQQFLDNERQRQDQFALEVDKLRSEGQQVVSDLGVKAKEIIGELEQHEAQARRLVSKTGSDAVSGGFLGEAERQKKRADFMTEVGFALVGLIVAYGFLVVVVFKEPVISIDYLAGRLLVVLPLVGLAIYAFRLAAQHRRAESTARAMELDHAALDPYLELLPDEDKYRLKAAITDRAFFRASAMPPDEDVTKDLIGLLRDAIKGMSGK